MYDKYNIWYKYAFKVKQCVYENNFLNIQDSLYSFCIPIYHYNVTLEPNMQNNKLTSAKRISI